MKRSLDTIKKDFPILSQGTIYLDSAASALTPTPVLDTVRAFYETNYANVHRGNFEWSIKASEQFETARKTIADHFGADANEIVFTSGATESLNLIAEALCDTLSSGDEIAVTLLEHHSNYLPWLKHADRVGATLIVLPLTEEGIIDLQAAKEQLSDNTKILAFTAESNTTGAITDISGLTKLAPNAISVIDGAQHAAHFTPDLHKLNVDFYVFSGHKMLGPTGTGGFYAKQEHLEWLDPAHVGGGMVAGISADGPVWKNGVEKWEPGTQNIAGAIGLAKAITYLEDIGEDRVQDHIQDLVAYTIEQLDTIEGVEIYGPKDPLQRGGVVSFNVQGVHPHDVAEVLNQKKIAIRAGRHCAFLFMDSLAIPGMCRASFHVYNTRADVDALVSAIHQSIKLFA